ncbi:antibiotic biosynthesis monooxygenase family protein [Micromonospora sp. WMMA1363]|uniref:putative quinol monooxygenase n=1 Tax=Micromonospora sp. WMMA1363 TaxID=3053985 RepID=UPI00259CF65B|nr:antibiotic biosynthesis monooxygenase family protein [Micromonospora sp. WMMA1363]MDM4722653.1 antibiotic biosynthesis monooxygenase family protein [Micromonospora sp. WMMA1363]
MFIVAGSLYVDPEDRDDYLAGCVEVVTVARATPGCVDFAISPDLVEPGRVNVYERWESEEELLAFRSSGPTEEQQVAIRGAEVHRYMISSVEAP